MLRRRFRIAEKSFDAIASLLTRKDKNGAPQTPPDRTDVELCDIFFFENGRKTL